MKKYLIYSLLIFITAGLTSCKKEEAEGPDKYAFWQGAITNTYYTLDLCGGQTGEVSGKPYMILEYDPITGVPSRCEFGLSSAVYTALPRENPQICLGSPPKPTLLASNFGYANRLGLTGSVDLISNWGTVTVNSTLPGGGYDFTISTGNGTFHFEHTNGVMTGEIVDEGQSGWGDAVSALNAFNMLHKFNSNTIDD